MNKRFDRFAVLAIVLILVLSNCHIFTSCSSRTYMIEDNDIEMYVGNNGKVLEQIIMGKRKEIIKPQPLLFNTLILYPKLQLFTIQEVDEDFRDETNLITGKYYTYGDTIVCVTDYYYAEADDEKEGRQRYSLEVEDSIDYSEEINLGIPRWFIRQSKDMLICMDYRPFLVLLDSGRWHKSDFDLKNVKPQNWDTILRCDVSGKLFMEEDYDKSKASSEVTYVMHRVPIKVKAKLKENIHSVDIITGKADTIGLFYRPTKP